MNDNVRIARELVRIAKMISASGEAPSGIREIDSVSGAINSILPAAHAEDEYDMHEMDGEYWGFIDKVFSESDFKDKDAYAFLVDRDENGNPYFRVVFPIDILPYHEHWSGRHDDYSPSYDYGPFPNSEDVAVFASIEDVEDGGYVHIYDITEAVGGAAISNMSGRIEKVTYDDYIPQADSLDDDF